MALAEGASTLGHLDEVSLAIDVVVRRERGDVEISKSSAGVGPAQFDCNCGRELLALGKSSVPAEHRFTESAKPRSRHHEVRFAFINIVYNIDRHGIRLRLDCS